MSAVLSGQSSAHSFGLKCAEDSARYSSRLRAPAFAQGYGAASEQEQEDESVRELLKSCFVKTNTGLEIFQRKIFVWRMCAAIGQCESHEQCFDAENF